jgi:hypothetical protein
MQDPVTYDMSDFGSREMGMAADLLNAYRKQHPEWLGNGVKVAMNRNSGCVFLTDEDYNSAMMNGEKLELWLFTPYEGHEGFLSDLLDEYAPTDLNGEDERYLRDMIETLNVRESDIPQAWRNDDGINDD